MPTAPIHRPAARLDRLDALRGAAMVWMMGFHLSFDLNQARLMPPQDFYRDPFWTLQRTLIVSLFLLCAGAGQALALRQGQPAARFWRRWAQIAGCALAVSAGSALMFPRSWISFGVLHGIAAMLLVVRWAIGPRLAPGRPAWPWVLAAVAAVSAPALLQHPFFDSRWTNWVGLVTYKPFTEDFVPLLPWLGVLLAGLLGVRWLLDRRPAVVAGPLPRAAAGLALLGRWPLTVYMLHQPVFLGLIAAGRRLAGG